jgi:hypothetical protein
VERDAPPEEQRSDGATTSRRASKESFFFLLKERTGGRKTKERGKKTKGYLQYPFGKKKKTERREKKRKKKKRKMSRNGVVRDSDGPSKQRAKREEEREKSGFALSVASSHIPVRTCRPAGAVLFSFALLGGRRKSLIFVVCLTL